MESKRQDEIDILKAAAIAAVVAIHAMGRYYQRFLPWSDQWDGLVTWDQVLRFSVPLFVALSGYIFAKKYFFSKLDLKEFFVRRVLRLLPWYLVFAGLSFYFYPNSYPVWQAFLLGKAEYHLYFVPMIFQLYVLFPIILWLVRKFPKIILLLSLVWQIYLFQFIFPGQYSDQEQYLFFGSWLWYFILGIYLGAFEIKNFLFKIYAPLLIPLGLLWAIGNTFETARIPIDLIVATRFTKTAVLVYASGVILTGGFWGKYLNRLPGILIRPLAFVGRNSYLIYLSHVIILRILYRYF